MLHAQVSAFFGHKKGAFAALIGGLAGAGYKYGGDLMYSNARNAWIRNRVNALNSPIRVLDIRKPQFPPRNNTIHNLEKKTNNSDDVNITPPSVSGFTQQQQQQQQLEQQQPPPPRQANAWWDFWKKS